MVRLGILEDEPTRSEEMKAFIRRYTAEHAGATFSIDVFDTGEKLLNAFRGQYDVLFLDIQLPDILGIDVAGLLREQDDKVLLVFVTNLTQYAIDGYSVQAFDYVLKPLLYDAFAAKLERVLRVIRQRRMSKVITLKSKEETWKLRSDEISYIESMGHTLVFHTKGKPVSIWGTLAKYEEELEGCGFSRCNASYLVNLKYVEQIRSKDVLVAGDCLPLGKTRRKPFLTDLAAYKGGNG